MPSQEVRPCGAVCRYPGKGIAHVSYSMALDAPIEATVFGTKGTVKIHDRAHNPTKLTFTPTGTDSSSFRGTYASISKEERSRTHRTAPL